MKSIVKGTISLFLLVTIVFSSTSCILASPYARITMDGVSYSLDSNSGGYSVSVIYDKENPNNLTSIFVMDYMNGYPVIYIGDNTLVTSASMSIRYSITERIYFPWTIVHYFPNTFWLLSEKVTDTLYLFSCTNYQLIGYETQGYTSDSKVKNVVTNWMYEYMLAEDFSYMEYYNEAYLPANISFMFNHAGNPNEGYFFIDLVEETGKITTPPYNPRREGYDFLGWYKDEACTEEWNFETDEVEILFDEKGNRVYEEIKLYARWAEQEDYGKNINSSGNIVFLLNYEGAPNDGCFDRFAQKADSTIRKPSTEPKRIGYYFIGWFKDEACTEEWDFKTDKVDISFDEHGVLIDEEIRLYAKWARKINGSD